MSLGCPKALVDAERILTRLRGDGYDIVPTYTGANVVVVNTCGFIDSARAESLAAIGEAVAANGRVIVTGCLGVEAERIRALHPAVLSISGPQRYGEVVAAVHAHAPITAPAAPRVAHLPPQGIKLTPPHYAYLKIAEGCNHRCTFCIIPALRGPLVSRGVAEVLEEAERLAAAGVREILVIAQDTGAYGVDRRYRGGRWRGRHVRGDFAGLCAALAELGVWIRLHYVYPYPHVDTVIPLMAAGRILPYLDVPFQHASPRILKAMRRPAATEDTLARIARWRAMCPELAIRSTLIVGFPGETASDFARLLEFLEAAQLDRVGCFPYSAVDGARANALPGHVPEELKQERWERLMETQAQISHARMARRVGRRLAVLIDNVGAEVAIGRTTADAPEIDGQVHVDAVAGIASGQIVYVRIDRADTYDLFGHVE